MPWGVVTSIVILVFTIEVCLVRSVSWNRRQWMPRHPIGHSAGGMQVRSVTAKGPCPREVKGPIDVELWGSVDPKSE